jgi:type VI secretion system protein ImpJ
MSWYRKVVWNEGMLLMPHHFQQWDNYHEALLNSRINSLMPFNYGVLDLHINHESVANGNFQLIICRAVMPDGLLINIPDSDPEPSLRPIIEHFTPETERLGVYLAVPAQKFGGANFQANGAPANVNVRFLQEGALVKDETTGTNEQPVAFAKPNLRIIFDDELRDGWTAIKIAELERTPTGKFQISDKYIPPILNVSASQWLTNVFRQIIEVLITKSSVLSEQRRQSRASLADFTTSEVASFWLLHTVNSAIPTLTHYFYSPLLHPEKLYLKLAELVGELDDFFYRTTS